MPNRECPICKQNVRIVPVEVKGKDKMEWALNLHWSDQTKSARCIYSLKRLDEM